MKLITAPDFSKHHYELPPKALREFHALRATAIDARRFPILAAHWPLVADDDERRAAA
jgi:hypothetical protein